MGRISVSAGRVKGWTTHMPMILKVMLNSTGPVLEAGGGPYSTPLLHWLCKIQGRDLVTYEDTPLFYEMCHMFTSRHHKIIFVEDWDTMDFNTHWGVVFIDHHPALRRGTDVLNFKDKADYIIMHDTQAEAEYDYARVWEHFKYRYDYKDVMPWTSVVSNFKPLDFLK